MLPSSPTPRAPKTSIRGRRAAALLTSLFLLCFGSSAAASQSFPEGLQKELGLECAPACITCHTVPEGGSGTTNATFGEFAKAIYPQLKDNMPLAVDIMRMQDTDMDGVTDADELINNTDPGVPGEEGGPVCAAVQYGCGAHVAPGVQDAGSPVLPDFGAALAALGVALLLVRQHRTAQRNV